MLSCVFSVARQQGASAQDERSLQLEVYINDTPTHLIGSFIQSADGRMAARRAELAEIGFKAPGLGDGEELIIIDDLSDVAYRYDEPAQKIFFSLGDERRISKTYNLRGSSSVVSPSPVEYGGVLNYAFFAGSTKSLDSNAIVFSGANASLDARLFGPYGTLSQSAILGSTTTPGMNALRLDTTWSYSNPETLLSYRAGDTISGGLAWTRSIRMGGLQVQRNFALQPDLVTIPLPAVSGNAAVPSTLDVYVNNVRTHSQGISAGPYQITNVPLSSGAGTARVVLRDAAGREIETILPFYNSPKLLKEGLSDFSIEAGLPRILYGTASSSYVDTPVASASLRGGIFDWLTVESHAEGSSDFFNGGLGSVTRLGSWGILSLAQSGSRFGGEFGLQSYAAFDTEVFGIKIHASAKQTFANYNDLASITARHVPVHSWYSLPSFTISSSRLLTHTSLPKSLNTIALGIPLPFDRTWLNIGYVHQTFHDDSKRLDIVNATYSRPLFTNAHAYLSAYSDLSQRRNYGVFFGLSMPLGGSSSPRDSALVSTGVSSTRSGTNVTFDAVKSLQPEPGSYGWRVRDSEGRVPYRYAAGSYRSSIGQFDGYVQQVDGRAGGHVQAQGSVVAMGGGLFLSNRIDDAFAVVDVGAPGVNVFFENRPAGITNAQGQLLIPGLRSYQTNKIAIDPSGLPIDADAPVTQNVVAPADRSGVMVAFDVKTNVQAAVVVLTGKDGQFIAPGSLGRLESANESFVVGYDGRAYVKGLSAINSVIVTDGTRECRASFPFAPERNSQLVIGPVVCQ